MKKVDRNCKKDVNRKLFPNDYPQVSVSVSISILSQLINLYGDILLIFSLSSGFKASVCNWPVCSSVVNGQNTLYVRVRNNFKRSLAMFCLSWIKAL